ncbi:1-acyl-sn-glycerol-3-phosphate acyltransferase [Baekduia soli]|uniref:1-acyl-sn-glycerol-3-phosphate acyltransferase n=1 Tax=Baekduia soli TaxID=496014 RepID=A0A5B8U5U1_9ACTN|nr:lysophospholipid acyltransferase family protein [Baekduia soli]QEC48453.1 1-acyl-sn-glycerol-3-phosphate acyltransferase [Baekduia soli]
MADRSPFARLDAPWARRPPARAVREVFLMAVLGPIMDLYTRRRVGGRRHLSGVRGPVVFVANHSSHMDTPTILRSLPRHLRRRTAVAAAADYFYRSRTRAAAVSLAFNTVPMQRHGGGLHPASTQHVDELLQQRWSLLMFAEGTRSRRGDVGRLRSGAAVLAAQHDVALVPVYVGGTHAAMPPGQGWPRREPGRGPGRRHPIEVRFGPPIRPRAGEDRRQVMERVRLFFAESGATTTPAGRGADAAAPALGPRTG